MPLLSKLLEKIYTWETEKAVEAFGITSWQMPSAGSSFAEEKDARSPPPGQAEEAPLYGQGDMARESVLQILSRGICQHAITELNPKQEGRQSCMSNSRPLPLLL